MTLVVANFGDQVVDVAVIIPQHALDCAQLPHGNYNCEELLTGETRTASLSAQTAVNIHIAPHEATIWHFKQD
jgi:hypothetical protein